ncbi:MAG: hypothetical protein QM668_06910 [Agriterribacter sp.]
MNNILLTFLFGLLLSSCADIIPEPHSLKYQDKEFNDLANFILDQKDIYEMDDFTRHYKRLNGVSIKLNDKEGNQNAQFLYIVEDSLRLDTKKISALRKKLEDTKLRDFIKSGDTILFTVDGFLDNSWGFMYSKGGLKMDTIWFDFKGNSIKFVEDINKNWKRTAIH